MTKEKMENEDSFAAYSPSLYPGYLTVSSAEPAIWQPAITLEPSAKIAGVAYLEKSIVIVGGGSEMFTAEMPDATGQTILKLNKTVARLVTVSETEDELILRLEPK